MKYSIRLSNGKGKAGISAKTQSVQVIDNETKCIVKYYSFKKDDTKQFNNAINKANNYIIEQELKEGRK